MKPLCCFLLLLATAIAEPRTVVIAGKAYSRATVQRLDAYTARIAHADGSATIAAWEFSESDQKQFGFDPIEVKAEHTRRGKEADDVTQAQLRRERARLAAERQRQADEQQRADSLQKQKGADEERRIAEEKQRKIAEIKEGIARYDKAIPRATDAPGPPSYVPPPIIIPGSIQDVLIPPDRRPQGYWVENKGGFKSELIANRAKLVQELEALEPGPVATVAQPAPVKPKAANALPRSPTSIMAGVEEEVRAKYGAPVAEEMRAPNVKALTFETNGIRIVAILYKERVMMLSYTRKSRTKFDRLEAEALLANHGGPWKHFIDPKWNLDSWRFGRLGALLGLDGGVIIIDSPLAAEHSREGADSLKGL